MGALVGLLVAVDLTRLAAKVCWILSRMSDLMLNRFERVG
jgi:hypothetical protein